MFGNCLSFCADRWLIDALCCSSDANNVENYKKIFPSICYSFLYFRYFIKFSQKRVNKSRLFDKPVYNISFSMYSFYHLFICISYASTMASWGCYILRQVVVSLLSEDYSSLRWILKCSCVGVFSILLGVGLFVFPSDCRLLDASCCSTDANNAEHINYF